MTGRLAAEAVKRVVERFDDVVEVFVANTDVASLAPLSEIERAVRYAALNRIRYVMIPGLHAVSRSILEDLSRRYDVVVFKGPKDLDSVPEVLARIVDGRLIPKPGDSLEEVLGGKASLRTFLNELKLEGFRLRNGIVIPYRPPPVHVFAEAYIFGDGSVERLRVLARKASCLVLGFPASYSRQKALELLEAVRKWSVCLGVDSPDDELLVRAASNLLVDVVLSVHPDNTGILRELPEGTGVVLLPSHPASPLPSVGERVKVLERLSNEAVKRKLVPIADLVVKPPLMGLVESITAYFEASKKLKVPLLAGLGNVYELLDADTHGVIALLSAIFVEAGVSIFLVSEASRKATGAVLEALLSSLLSSAAKHWRRVPKDVGVDLLVLKEKQARVYKGVVAQRIVDAWEAKREPFVQDPLGYLQVWVEDCFIYVTLLRNGKPILTLRARNAEEAYRAAVAHHMVSRLDHAAYLGYELAKAELALNLGKSYVQDEPVLVPLGKRFANTIAEYLRVLRSGKG